MEQPSPRPVPYQVMERMNEWVTEWWNGLMSYWVDEVVKNGYVQPITWNNTHFYPINTAMVLKWLSEWIHEWVNKLNEKLDYWGGEKGTHSSHRMEQHPPLPYQHSFGMWWREWMNEWKNDWMNGLHWMNEEVMKGHAQPIAWNNTPSTL